MKSIGLIKCKFILKYNFTADLNYFSYSNNTLYYRVIKYETLFKIMDSTLYNKMEQISLILFFCSFFIPFCRDIALRHDKDLEALSRGLVSLSS